MQSYSLQMHLNILFKPFCTSNICIKQLEQAIQLLTVTPLFRKDWYSLELLITVDLAEILFINKGMLDLGCDITVEYLHHNLD